MGKLTNEEWFELLNNIENCEDGNYFDGEIKNVKIVYLGSMERYSLSHNDNILENGFETELDATNRLYELERLYYSHKIEELNFNIVVSCDCEIVFDGEVTEFIIINENDEYVINKCIDVLKNNKVKFDTICGHWEIKRV